MNTPFKIKYSQALQGFILTSQARRLSKHTIRDYTHTLTKFREFLGKDLPIADITTRHVEEFLAAQVHLSKKTVANYHVGLCALWTWLLREKYVTEHVPQGVVPPKPEIREIVPYSETEVRAMLNSLDRSQRYRRPGTRYSDHGLPLSERNRAIILLLLDTGIRAEELVTIKIHQLDKRNQRVRVFGKGAKERFVAFGPRTHQALWKYLATRSERASEGDPLFATQNGLPFSRYRLLDILRRIGKRAGVANVSVHRFRHTFAIQYLRNRGDPYTLQRLLGHSTLDMVKRYLAIAQTDIDAAHRLASPVENWTL